MGGAGLAENAGLSDSPSNVLPICPVSSVTYVPSTDPARELFDRFQGGGLKERPGLGIGGAIVGVLRADELNLIVGDGGFGVERVGR